MSLSDFKASPWARSHASYKGAALSMNPAPEYANSEVLVASLYRTISAFREAGETVSISEGRVPIRGRKLDAAIVHHRDKGRKPGAAALDGDSMHALLHNVLESPKLPNQSAKRFLQVTPLVGETASFSGSARLAGNPWPAGALLRQMIWLGSPSPVAAEDTWSRLFHALGVHDDDDIFARFLRDEISAWAGDAWGDGPTIPDGEEVACLPSGELDGFASPARQFCQDIDAVLAAKSVMTRRQWTSLIEALVRIAAVGHVAWLCEVHRHVWTCVQQSLAGEDLPDDLRSTIYPRNFGYLAYGMAPVAELRDRTSTLSCSTAWP